MAVGSYGEIKGASREIVMSKSTMIAPMTESLFRENLLPITDMRLI
jgi:hypothetical protein